VFWNNVHLSRSNGNNEQTHYRAVCNELHEKPSSIQLCQLQIPHRGHGLEPVLLTERCVRSTTVTCLGCYLWRAGILGDARNCILPTGLWINYAPGKCSSLQHQTVVSQPYCVWRHFIFYQIFQVGQNPNNSSSKYSDAKSAVTVTTM
jgi:hypothetical protein